MRALLRSLLTAALACVTALPLLAETRSQSYVSYDDGDSTLLQADGHDLELKRNVPIYPGDEIRSGRRGRTEVRLSDGNIIALDRDTVVRFQSILNSYEGDGSQTVADLRSGEVMLQRMSRSSSPLRLDTRLASYVASRNGVYSVETDMRGSDVVSVYEGSIEVRTRDDSTRVRAGEKAHVDNDGIYSVVELARDGSTDFERWFIERAGRYSYSRASRYIDGDLAYAGAELDSYGSWVYVSDYGSWVWRPRVNVGWRPYYNGWWRWGAAGLVWVSDEPWGWVPYHYGRWAYTPLYGWVWMPGYGYSPAWVYWTYGPSWVGWIPAGWYDCYHPYYNWLYQPYYRTGIDIGFGFHGRVRFTSNDIGAWTIVDGHALISNRTDRASLTADEIRNRLTRDGGMASITNTPLRFRNDEIKDPTVGLGRIIRGGVGSGTGNDGSGSAADVTSFFHRDPALSTEVRNRLTRGLPPVTSTTTNSGLSPRGSGGAASVPGRGDSPDDVVHGRNPGSASGGGTGSTGVITRPNPRSGGDGTITPRGSGGGTTIVPRDGGSTHGVDRPQRPVRIIGGDDNSTTTTPRGSDDWRNGGVARPVGGKDDDSSSGSTNNDVRDSRGVVGRDGGSGSTEWRNRPARVPSEDDEANDSQVNRGTYVPRSSTSGDTPADDTPRRVIGRIVGSRMNSARDDDGGSSSSRPSRPSGGSVDRGSSGSSHSSGGGSGTRSGGSSSGGSSGGSSSGGSRPSGSSSGGSHVHRDRG